MARQGCPHCYSVDSHRCPSPDEISVMAAEIRESWDDKEYRRRARWVTDELVFPQVIRIQDMGIWDNFLD